MWIRWSFISSISDGWKANNIIRVIWLLDERIASENEIPGRGEQAVRFGVDNSKKVTCWERLISDKG